MVSESLEPEESLTSSNEGSLIQASLVINDSGLQMDEPPPTLLKTFLSPIAEASEFNSTVSMSPLSDAGRESPSTASSRRLLFYTPHSQPSVTPRFEGPSPTPVLSNEVTVYTANPCDNSSTTPVTSRHRRSHSARCAPSPNPFARQGGDAGDLGLIHSLLSAQGDMLANTSSQRFILSSLITNLRGEIDRKDAMLRNVVEQNQVTENLLQNALSDAADWERAAKERVDGSRDRARLAALEDLVNKMSEELEVRTAIERKTGRKQCEQLAVLQDELIRTRSDVRDGEIRLRHARASQSDAETLRSRVELERDELQEQIRSVLADAEQLKRERDDLRLRVRHEAEERDRLARQLQEDVKSTVKAAAAATHDPQVTKELGRQIEKVRQSADREAAVLVAELETQKHFSDGQAQTISELRVQTRSLREDLAAVTEDARKIRSGAELARLEARTEAMRLRSELGEVRRISTAVQNELDDAQSRIETLEVEKDVVTRELETCRLAWEESVGAQKALVDTITRVEANATSKSAALAQAQEDLETLRRDMDALLDDRDQRLAHAQTALASRTAQLETIRKERDVLQEKVNSLRKESADREIKLARLNKTKTALSEDILGLNIALESKQQEVAMMKRQAAAARIGVVPSTSSRPRSTLSSASPVLQFPATRNREDTPSRVPTRSRPGLTKGADTSAERSTSVVGGKENSSPRKIPIARDLSRVRAVRREREGELTPA